MFAGEVVRVQFCFFPDRGNEQQMKINEQVGFFTVGGGPTEEIQ